MDREIQRFVSDFEAAIQASAQASASSRRAKAARRLATSLAKSLGEAGELDPAFLDLERRVRGIENKLGEIADRKTDLKPFIRKAQAMLDLDDILPKDALDQVRSLLKEAESTRPSSNRPGRMAFELGAECTDCREVIVGARRGTPRWGHVRTFITRHDERNHEGFSAQERLDLRAASTQLEDGATEVTVKRYRIFRTLPVG